MSEPEVVEAAIETPSELAKVAEAEVAKHRGKHPKLAAAWTRAWPFVRISLYGAAFVGGGIVLARFFGPKTARQLGQQGGEGFAEGVAKVQDRIASVTRGARWG